MERQTDFSVCCAPLETVTYLFFYDVCSVCPDLVMGDQTTVSPFSPS